MFGLPEREQLALVEPDCAIKAKDSLIEKGILLKEGKLTKTAFFLIKAAATLPRKRRIRAL
nr:DUF5081 family protein [Bacillus licheniformis]